MAFSQSTNIRLHYILSTKGETTFLQPRKFVLIHGLFFGNLASWYPLITQALTPYGDVLCYDLRGHGLSETPSVGYTLSHHSDDLIELLEELGWQDESLCFVGHSFGARIAIEMAKYRKGMDVKDQIILIDPPLLKDDTDDQSLFKWLKLVGIEGLKDHMPNSLYLLFSSEGRRFKKLLKRWKKLINTTDFLVGLETLDNPTKEELETIRSVGAILFGAQSGCYNAFPLVKGLLPTSRLDVLPDGGHFLLNQSPELVLAFIKTQVLKGQL